MTTWTTLSDATLAQDKPLTQSVARALRDNAIAIAEGAGSSPVIVGLNPSAIITASSPILTATFTDLPAVDVIDFEFLGIRPSATSHTLKMRVSINNGSSWISTGYYYSKNMVASTPAASQEGGENLGFIELSPRAIVDGGGTNDCSGHLQLFNAGSSAAMKNVVWSLGLFDTSSHFRTIVGAATAAQRTNPVNAVQFFYDNAVVTSNIAAGKIVCRPRRATVSN